MSVAPKDNMRADLDAMAEHLRGGAEVGSVPEDAPEPERGLLEEAPVLAKEEPEPPADETPAQKAERARAKDGTFVKEPKKAPEVVKKPALVPKPGAAAEAKPAAAVPGGTGAAALKAPSSWRPEVREKWAALPPEAQAEIVRRERQVDAALQENKALKERVGGYDSIVQPFLPMLRATGAEPRAAMGQMLQAQHTLVYGGPAQKAGLLANIIKGYGVPIEALATALDGASAPQGQAAAQQPAQFRDPRFDQFLSTLKARKTEMDQQTRAAAAMQWETFTAENEFAEDLREEIADLMEVGNRGQRQRTLAQAYDLALHSRADLRKVVEQRQAAAAATAQAAATQARKAAGGSLKSVPGGGSVDGEADSDGTVGGDLRKMLRASK